MKLVSVLFVTILNYCTGIRYIHHHQPLTRELIEFVNTQANTTWKAGYTRRFNTVSDIKRMLGTIPDPNDFKLPVMCKLSLSTFDRSLPKSFDARTHWPKCASIGLIRDQSYCGSCWAFGAVEAMSDRICIASNGTMNPILSAENLVDCCNKCGMGCFGGYPSAAWQYWKTDGIVTGGLYHSNSSCQPYSFPPCEHHVIGPRQPCDKEPKTPQCKRTCQPGYNKSYENDKWYGESVYTVGSDEETIMRELMEHGPLEVDFEVYADFPNYISGVYQHVTGGLLGGHAVRLLGWGEENNVKYWLIANSWNDDWGDKGYFKILRGNNECGIESDVTGGIPRLP